MSNLAVSSRPDFLAFSHGRHRYQQSSHTGLSQPTFAGPSVRPTSVRRTVCQGVRPSVRYPSVRRPSSVHLSVRPGSLNNETAWLCRSGPPGPDHRCRSPGMASDHTAVVPGPRGRTAPVASSRRRIFNFVGRRLKRFVEELNIFENCLAALGVL